MRAARPRRPAAILALALAFLPIVAAACGAGGSTASPNPDCPSGDRRAAGTDPALEALLPRGMIERTPDTVDSGWSCSPEALGSYATHGVTKLRFAGATWDNGGGDATVAAILANDGGPLDVAWVEEFYTIGALNGRHTENVKTARPTMRGAGQVFRLDTLNNLSLQTVVIWPAGPYVRVVIVATTVEPDASRAAHEQRVETAVEVAAAVPTP